MKHATILVCITCRDATGVGAPPHLGELLYEATRAAATDSGARVLPVECLANCNRRLSAAILREDGWSYVFGDLAVENARDLLAGANLYAESPGNDLPWIGLPECLKRGLISRLPPSASFSEPAP